jgi:hypothetical protein
MAILSSSAVMCRWSHLAAALGRPVWMLLPFVPDWRWLLDRDDTPWYPTIRLFRQPARGDWDNVIARIATALRAAVDARAARTDGLPSAADLANVALPAPRKP